MKGGIKLREVGSVVYYDKGANRKSKGESKKKASKKKGG